MPFVLQEQAAPAQPAAGYVIPFALNETTPKLAIKDDAGIVTPLAGLIFTSTSGDFTGTNVNTAQPVFDTTEDVLTVTAGQAYILDACYHIHTTGTNSHTLGLLFGGTATYTSIGYSANVTNAATEVTGSGSTLWVSAATVTVVTAALASATHHTCILNGVIRVNGAGTIIPQYQWSAAPGVAGVTLANSYFKLTPIGASAIKASPSTMWS